MQTKNFQRPPAPLMSPMTTEAKYVEVDWAAFFSPLGDMIGYGPTIYDTHANRIALEPGSNIPLYPPGRFLNYLFYETDRTVFYHAQLVAGVATWVYVSGAMRGTLSPDQKPTLGTADAGFEFDSTDYFHIFRWTGAAWTFKDGDASEYVVSGSPRGGPPQGGLWGLCDGTAYNVAQPNGTLVSVTTQALTGDVALLGAATPDAAQRAAARATWEAGAKTGIESVKHTHDTAVLGESVQPGADPAVIVGQDDTYTSGLDSVDHDHPLTDALSQLKVPSEANGGLGKRIAVTKYMRR